DAARAVVARKGSRDEQREPDRGCRDAAEDRERDQRSVLANDEEALLRELPALAHPSHRLSKQQRVAASYAGCVDEEGFGGFQFGGNPEDLMRRLREFAEQQAESVAEAQREQFATLTLNTAVDLTSAALNRMPATG